MEQWRKAYAGIYGTVDNLINAHENLLEAILQNTSDSWDRDEAAEHIAIEYVHFLEQEMDKHNLSREKRSN